jgi:hypothetical protein
MAGANLLSARFWLSVGNVKPASQPSHHCCKKFFPSSGHQSALALFGKKNEGNDYA